MDDGASLTSEAGRPRASLLSKLIAKLKWTAAQMSRKSAPSMDAQFHIDQLEHISHNSLQCPKLRCIVTTAGSYCIRNGANTSEVVRPAFKPALRKRGEEHTNGDHMDVYGIVPRQGYGTKEATQACQAKDFEYYCDTDGEVKNKGKYNDEQCDEYCDCIDLDPKPNCIIRLSYNFASSCLRKRDDGSGEPLWEEKTADEIEAMEKRGEVVVDRRWLDATASLRSTPGFGPSNNAGSSARNPLRATALSQVKKLVHLLVHGNVDKLDKKEPQSPFENGGLNPDLNHTAISSATSLRSALDAFGIFRLMHNLF
ncbi:hypothetical protein LTR24_006756 [Lithohypha guttulata]|uniref:Glucosidase 2 subunit beta n=1 Tax=Lithohypha guttulata TaxID=1690604 RepID=A0ABR0K6M8_9EURO|nr:hypothetical protein LTR24_006756 [Lithohypha guttulata]